MSDQFLRIMKKARVYNPKIFASLLKVVGIPIDDI